MYPRSGPKLTNSYLGIHFLLSFPSLSTWQHTSSLFYFPILLGLHLGEIIKLPKVRPKAYERYLDNINLHTSQLTSLYMYDIYDFTCTIWCLLIDHLLWWAFGLHTVVAYSLLTKIAALEFPQHRLILLHFIFHNLNFSLLLSIFLKRFL